MVLHPTHKLTYFKNASWESDWIDTAEEIVREEYATHYEGLENIAARTAADAVDPAKVRVYCSSRHY